MNVMVAMAVNKCAWTVREVTSVCVCQAFSWLQTDRRVLKVGTFFFKKGCLNNKLYVFSHLAFVRLVQFQFLIKFNKINVMF